MRTNLAERLGHEPEEETRERQERLLEELRYREAMRRNLAEALGLDVSQVSVKATTEERLGFTGDGSGMAAQAIALLEKAEGTPCDGGKESA